MKENQFVFVRKKKDARIRVGRLVRISQRPDPRWSTSGMPRGHRNCTVLMSSPMIFRSSFDKFCSHARTGSRPASVRKKKTWSRGDIG